MLLNKNIVSHTINFSKQIIRNFTIKNGKKFNEMSVVQLSNNYSTSSTDKKKGQYVEIQAQNNEVKKVKLYPGFQKSAEDIQQENSDNQELFAKKVIEDFYGLNTLEMEDQSEFNKENQDTEDENAVFDLDYVVRMLQNENVQDVCCIQIPKEINYADYMIVGSCFSDKHLNSSFININRKYKKLKKDGDLNLQRKSGKETKWCAIDTGNVVIHLFTENYREFYDLESLWTCGTEFDDKYNEFIEKQKEIERNLIVVED